MQDVGVSNVSSINSWVSGGVIGSKNAVLVFKTTALARNVSDDDDLDQPSTSSIVRFPPVSDAKPLTSCGARKTATVKKQITFSYEVDRKRFIKPHSDSLSSSSENSISSACEDPAEFEADIVDAEKSNSENNKLTTEEAKATIKEENEASEQNEVNAMSTTTEDTTILNNEHVIDDTFDEMPATLLNITYKFTNTETKLLKRILTSHGLKEAKENQNFSLLWTGLHMKPDILRNLLPYQRVNHFPR